MVPSVILCSITGVGVCVWCVGCGCVCVCVCFFFDVIYVVLLFID